MDVFIYLFTSIQPSMDYYGYTNYLPLLSPATFYILQPQSFFRRGVLRLTSHGLSFSPATFVDNRWIYDSPTLISVHLFVFYICSFMFTYAVFVCQSCRLSILYSSLYGSILCQPSLSRKNL